MKVTFSQYLLEYEYDVYTDTTINEMANLSRQSTQLPVIIYVSDNRGVSHGPRIKCNAGYGNWTGQSFTVTIDHEPRVIGKTGEIKPSDIETIRDWVKLNYEPLVQYWKMEIDIAEFVIAMRPV